MSDTTHGQPAGGTVADAKAGNWVDRLIPAWGLPYARLARLDRPIGWWLLMWPCWWSVALAAVAAGTAPNPWHLLLFMVGAIVMRGAGCTYNDIIDRDIDAGVERTKSRPIPSGQVSPHAALLFMVGLALIGLVVLLQFNTTTILTALGSLAIVAFYPLAKRVTDWPQVVLGFAFSWGAFLGWTATFGELGFAPLALYIGCIAWTVGYDTVYAHQDKRDDAIIGVRSTARLFGQHTRLALILAYGGAVFAFAVAIALAGGGAIAWLGLTGFAIHLAWQLTMVATDDPTSCLKAFRSNKIAGWILFAGLGLDALYKLMISG